MRDLLSLYVCPTVRSGGNIMSPVISIHDKSKSGSTKDKLKGSAHLKADVKLVDIKLEFYMVCLIFAKYIEV